MKLFKTRGLRREQVSLADTAAVVNTAMQLQDELSNLTDDELELWHWGAQHITGLRVCGGTPDRQRLSGDTAANSRLRTTAVTASLAAHDLGRSSTT